MTPAEKKQLKECQRIIKKAYELWYAGKLDDWESSSSPYICDNLDEAARYFDLPSYRGSCQILKDFVTECIDRKYDVQTYLGMCDEMSSHDFRKHPDVIKFRQRLWETLAVHYGIKL